jgi:hypothetical protein
MAERKPADGAGLSERIAALEAENAVLARVVLHLVVRLPGSPESIERILTGQLGLPHDAAEAVVAAARRPLQR